MARTGPVRPRRRRFVVSSRPARFAAAAALIAALAATRCEPPVAHAAPPAQSPNCTIAGTLRLTGADAHAGIVVRTTDGAASTTTDAGGAFRLTGVAPGEVALRASRPRHLSAAAEAVPCPSGAMTTMAAVELPGGDADGNDRVDLFDLVRIGAHYRQCAGEADFDPLADLDDSGCVNLFDLVRVTAAYGVTGPRPWAVADVAEPDPDPGPDPDPEPVSFRDDVLPIFDRDCRTCHGFVAGLNLASYAGLMAGGNSGPSIVPGDPQASLLYLKVSRQVSPAMPPGGVRLSDADVATIRRWIEAGAHDD